MSEWVEKSSFPISLAQSMELTAIFWYHSVFKLL